MVVIGQKLFMENVLSKRIKISQADIPLQMEDVKKKCEESFFVVKSLTTITYAVDKTGNDSILDLEILIELQNDIKEVSIPSGYKVKEKILITNALSVHYEGPRSGSNNAFKEINSYLINNNLMAITPVYSVSNNPFRQSENNINLDLYIGINPNIM